MLGILTRMDESLFRLYDVRGRYPHEIHEGVAFAIARKLNRVFGSRGHVVVLWDGRTSSPALAAAVIAGLRDAGLTPIVIGCSTYPSLTFFVHYYKAIGGVAITASHNPPEYNGLKFVNSNSIPIGGKTLANIIGPLKMPVRERYPMPRETIRDIRPYIQSLKKIAKIRRPVKVVCDASNGATARILNELGAVPNLNYEVINGTIHGSFPAHGPNPTVSNAWQQAARMVAQEKADMGIVFDGDGDRAVIIDNKGRIVRPEHVLRLLLCDPKTDTAVVSSVGEYLANLLMRDMNEKNGVAIRLVESRVGRTNVNEAMRKYKADIGVEHSSHFFFKEFYFNDSGMVAAIKIMNILSRLPYALSDFIDLVPTTYALPEKEISVSVTEQKTRLLDKAYGYLKKYGSMRRFDGVTMNGKHVWVNLRPSNTEPVLRLNIEGGDKKTVRAFQKNIVSLLG